MRKKNILLSFLILLIIFAGVFFIFSHLKAYDTVSTHPFLTKQIVKLYNEIYFPKITDSQVQQLVQGSIDEDVAPRWINHFYDPITGQGWLGKRLGDLPVEQVIEVSKVVFNKEPVSTLDWVHNQDLQVNDYGFYQDNRTFEKAVLFYSQDQKDNAYYTLGHILHDIEDMAVPAHTRQDSHFDMPVPEIVQLYLGVRLDKGEPYEKWAEQYTSKNSADLTNKLKNNYKPICNSLDNCLIYLAEYSNNNFFSSDTILDEEYELPKIKFYNVEGDYINAYGDSGLLFKITRGDGEKSLKYDDIHQAYWDKLSVKAVLAGVEVIRYFQEQAEKVKKGEIVIAVPSEPGFFDELTSFSPYGQMAKMYKEGKASVADFWKKLVNFGNDITSRFAPFLSSSLPGFAIEESIPSNSFTVDNSKSREPDAEGSFYIGTGGPQSAIMTELGRQDLLDDIAEQLDIINQQVQELQGQQNPKQTLNPNDQIPNPKQIPNSNEQKTTLTGSVPVVVSSSGGGSTPVVYPKILISEIQIAGPTDEKEEFVELYNPNDAEVDLSSWYLQRKTATGSSYLTFASNTLFSGKKINAKGYFLIARQGYFSSAADISNDNPITDDNSFVLKNPNGEISDKLGFGQAQDYELLPAQNPGDSQTIGRKNLSDGTEQDTDNNSVDFELQNPSPKAKNSTFIEPPVPPSPNPTDTISIPKKVLINEIQIDSVIGNGGTDDDWVELYNPNNIAVSLSGWSIQKHSSDFIHKPCSIDISFYKKNFSDNAIIPAKGFFLIVGTKAQESLKTIADMTIGWSLSENNTIYLVRNQDKITDGSDIDIVDKVGFGLACFAETEPALNPPETRSIERKRLGEDMDNNADDFRISDEPTPKTASPKVYIEDATDYSNLGYGSPGTFYYNLKIKWYSKSPSLQSFQVQYKLNDGDWKDWLQDTTKTEENFQAAYSLFNDKVYKFRARVKDSDGNLGSWLELTVDIAIPVIFNEIAFYGTGSDALKNDQWIELYNRTDKDIDLTGWKIASNSLNIDLQGIIPAKGYFLLEKNDDNVISDIQADQIFTGFVPLTGNLYLRNKTNRYIDEAYIYAWGWSEVQFVKEGNYYSLERLSPYSFGSGDKNWKLNNGQILNGINRDGNLIYATPKSQNSDYQLYTYIFTSFVEDMVLPKSLSPYLFSGSTLFVLGGATLTIEPGVVIKTYNNWSGIMVDGTLKAIGTDSEKIVFTAFRDDEYVPGLWLGIKFNSDSINSELENVVVRYAGAYIGSSDNFGAGITVNNSSILLKNSIIEKNSNKGLWLINSDSTVDAVQFIDQKENASGIYIQGGSPQIKNSYFKGNYQGIFISDWERPGEDVVRARALIDNNNFEENTEPILMGTFYSSFTNNRASSNGFDAIVISIAAVRENATLRPDLPYLSRGIFEIPENIILTLEPGVILAFQSNWAGLQIAGTLKAVGTTDNPIIFRSYYYDQLWVTPGNWLGLSFTKTSINSELENINISLGGNYFATPANEEFSAAIRVNQSSISLKNSLVGNNANNGVWLTNSSSIIDSVQFFNHRISGLRLPAKAIFIQGGSPEVKNSYLQSQTYGIYKDSYPTPNLHTDPEDPEKNTFMDTDTPGGDIFDASFP